MYLRHYQDIILALHDIKLGDLILASEASPIKKLLIQKLSREVDGKTIDFIALRDIYVDENHRRNGVCKKVIDLMESSGDNIMVDDIISDDLFHYLVSKDFIPYSYKKNDGKLIRSVFKLKTT
jgi:hypothetical protein